MSAFVRTLLLVLVISACDALGPRPVCGCEPPMGGQAVITGVVVDAASVPVSASQVTWQLLPNAPCSSAAAALPMSETTTSSTSGRFRLAMAWAGANKCFRVYALGPAGSLLAPSDTQVVGIDFSGVRAVPDSIELTLRLR